MRATCPVYSLILLDLFTLIVIGEEYKLLFNAPLAYFSTSNYRNFEA
jgi:hypothetical protein